MPIYIGYRGANAEGVTEKPVKVVFSSLTTLKNEIKKLPGSKWEVRQHTIKGTEALVQACLNTKKLKSTETLHFEVTEGGRVKSVDNDG